MTTSPSHTTAAARTLKPAYKGLYLVSRKNQPTAGSPQTASTPALTLVTNQTSGTPNPAESIRLKLAACFGALVTAPAVWCLHSLLLHSR